MKKHINEIINVSNEIYNKGLVSGKAGNISKRIKGSTGDIVAITPTLKSLSYLKEEDIVLVDMDGNLLTRGKPSSELNMHLEIYKKRSDVNAIVHTHSTYATGFAFSSKKLKRLEGFGEIKNPYLNSIEYFKPGTSELAKNASEGIKNEDVLILKNHGVICVSDKLKEAKLLSIFVEESAKTQFVTCMLNSVED
ncbi:L-fuculose-phosphate aldolase [Methanobrevibacter gottschalkii]|uniref:L-fuculose-phosphate aldolase n=2 Tax=Methanobrevibacter gottschalkii TaxID=190974 RepID=A0A3N5BBQ1_9EURY|nr:MULTISPECIES: class II aldolase/adducin family protein [Methanobrevibacter]MCQ2971215.1 class II aldolase/adducin family protein [archaeon]OEC99920.1 fructose-bisphosphate aldolase [Methanobrevibacter sp. A27]RPF52860.1 L-fuculose-phosphate aldolase [Methanobrevibacter gottschalkii DSM 11977]SEK18921.1 L-fuculose-phosphate aldolase [Methanobrevibacter gottschalkii]